MPPLSHEGGTRPNAAESGQKRKGIAIKTPRWRRESRRNPIPDPISASNGAIYRFPQTRLRDLFSATESEKNT
jgi:hypothetical protein